jgi:hypothetical protein
MEIQRTAVQGQADKKLLLPPPNLNKPSVVVHTCDSNYTRGQGWEDCILKPALGKNMRPYLKITKAKRAGGMAQVEEDYLTSMRPLVQIPVLYSKAGW